MRSPRSLHLSLRAKIVLILTVVVALWATADNFLLDRMVTGRFRALGEEEAEDGMRLVEGSLELQIRQLANKAGLFASLPAVRRAVSSGDRAFIAAQLGPRSLASANVDLLYVCAPDGTVLWGRIEAPESDEAISLRLFPAERLLPTHPLLARRGAELESHFAITERGIMLVSALPVEENGGAIILGRFLDESLIAEIEGHASLPFRIRNLREEALEPWERALLDRLTADPGTMLIHEDADGNLYAFKTLSGLLGRPDILLRTDIEHGVLARGKEASRYLALSTAGTSLLILLVLVRLLNKTVILPLSRLTSFAVRVAETDDTSARMDMERYDEVGILAAEFDRMLEEIERSRSMLVETARLAGMSEIATGVLHNVGNVLNSVNVSANLIHQKTEQLTVADLQRMVDVLEQHEEDLGRFVSEDPRGRHTLPLLKELSGSLERQRQAIRKEVAGLRQGIEHVAELVRSQQSYAGTRGVFEMTSLASQVDAAVKICGQALGGAGEVEIVREYDPDLPSVSIDRHKLMEILVNLIQNAKQALEDSDQSHKRIILRVLRPAAGTVRIEVEDNGVGIAPMNLENVFHHGFTTKKDGHGFGLHVSANAAQEMHSSLQVRSEGPGQGAVFVLDIPVPAEAPLQAA